MERKIAPKDVTLGMYILGFGGSWFDHPFWKARFEVKKERDLARIREAYIPFVIIDDQRGVAPAEREPEAVAPNGSSPRSIPPSNPVGKLASAREIEQRQRRRHETEMARAKTLVNHSAKVMRGVLEDARLGRAMKFKVVSSVVEEIVAGIERTPKAMLSVLRLKGKDQYTYFHSVAVCTLMANFARHRGLQDDAVREYGLAGLFHDIGKARIPDEILNKEGRLTDSEFQLIRDHPDHGHAILVESHDEIPDAALDVCRYHHEKMDGTGYPEGLSGNAIPEIARVGGICDVYDALTSDRAYKDAWLPSHALGEMWSWDGHFDRTLLFAFMQSIGIFPAGILVELRSNRLGLILENGRRNSRPRVLAFYDTRNRAFIEPKELVITGALSGDSIIAPAEAHDWGLGGYDLSNETAVRKLAIRRAA